MSIIRLDKITKAYAGEPILEDVDFRVEEGEKIGLIGRNGTGKSTLFRLITGETEAERGSIERMRNTRAACLSQMPDVDPEATIGETVMACFDDLIQMEQDLRELEHRIAAGDETVMDQYSHLLDTFSIKGGYEFHTTVKRVLTGLGFTESDESLPFRVLSGGQRSRLMLALVLLQDADMLLLDEPENHLDLEAREWLESFLRDWPRSLVIISHDRRMLNAVVGRIVEVERGGLTKYSGNYDFYQKQKVLNREQHEAEYRRQQEYIAKEESWINRFRYKATKAKQAQERLKRLEKLERIAPPAAEAGVVSFGMQKEVVRSSQEVLTAKNLSMGYGDLTLYEEVSVEVTRGERVGIIGPNGSGKTTLLRQMAGEHHGLGGEVILGNKVKMAYYDQHHGDLNPSSDILTEVQAARPKWKPEQIRSFLGRFLFRGDDVFKPISALSGGELARVSLARLLLQEPNVLLLDEPTNHLDIASREAMEDALESFPGSIVLVSHDRVLIDKLADKLIILEEGRAVVHLGNYSHFRWKQGEDAAAAEALSQQDVLRIRRDNGKKGDDNAKGGKKKRKQGKTGPDKKQMKELEERIAEMESLVQDKEALFAEIDPSNYALLQEQTAEYEGLKKDLAELYASWEETADTQRQQ